MRKIAFKREFSVKMDSLPQYYFPSHTYFQSLKSLLTICILFSSSRNLVGENTTLLPDPQGGLLLAMYWALLLLILAAKCSEEGGVAVEISAPAATFWVIITVVVTITTFEEVCVFLSVIAFDDGYSWLCRVQNFVFLEQF